MKADTATNKTLFDFQAATHSPAWEVVNDDVMGGVSTSQFQVLTNGCTVFSGMVRLENNGGFASVRSAPLRENLTGLAAFVLRVRGDGRSYKFSVRTGVSFDTPLYQCSFTTKLGEWEEYRLPFNDFVPTFRGRILTDVPPLNPANVTSVGFLISDKQEGPFKLEVAWIKSAESSTALPSRRAARAPTRKLHPFRLPNSIFFPCFGRISLDNATSSKPLNIN